ncbi:LysR family transcriptional regulator [Komagataeibacter rhaeticus]|uniref:LysR family transcriptional regulator n=1 Tax=Komagataeibacter rhaeticus TaxID=215221 RepID=UPI000557B243|nr:LysR family transcriptional regulator [Komagataeibacter rhaeticus]MBL7241180.1 LysR family transcriptional regulator [Komagataeibacter rhaeticus]PYD52401.1 LysR family transcriptional regulator [Komagataeibacter rhaeticus]
MDALSGLEPFVFAARFRSYVKAGRHLGISSSAVAKSVSRLEARLGVQLLNRTTRSIGLTEAGVVFYERCRQALEVIRDAEATLHHAKGSPSGRLRVNVPHIVGRHLLMPLIADFVSRYPEIELDIALEDRIVDLIEEDIDVVIRSGNLPDSRLIARRLGDQHFITCASASYLEASSRPLLPAEIQNHRCLRYRYPNTGLFAPWVYGPPHDQVRLPETMIFNNSDAALRAAADGLGLVHLPVYVARDAIASGHLIPLFEKYCMPIGSLWIIWPAARTLSPKVRAFADFVLERFAAMPEAFMPFRDGYGKNRFAETPSGPLSALYDG